MIMFASEDIGLADLVALDAASAFDRVGLPEGAFRSLTLLLQLQHPRAIRPRPFLTPNCGRKRAEKVPNHLKDASRDSDLDMEQTTCPHISRSLGRSTVSSSPRGAYFTNLQMAVKGGGRRSAQTRTAAGRMMGKRLQRSSALPPNKARDAWLSALQAGRSFRTGAERIVEALTGRHHLVLDLNSERVYSPGKRSAAPEGAFGCIHRQSFRHCSTGSGRSPARCERPRIVYGPLTIGQC